MKRARLARAIEGIAMLFLIAICPGCFQSHEPSPETGLAGLLARCKMAEIEEWIDREGLPDALESGSDGCCRDAEIEGFGCEWEVQPVALPESIATPEQTALPGGAGTGQSATAGTTAVPEPTAVLFGPAEGLDESEQMSLLAAQVYPLLKPELQARIRRVMVTVSWTQPDGRRSFDVAQYVAAGQSASTATPAQPDAGEALEPAP